MGASLFGISLFLSVPVTSYAARPIEGARGYYSPTKVAALKKDPTVQVYESYLYTLVERRIASDFSDLVWRASELQFEDGTHLEVDGPEGTLFQVENGGAYWGYRAEKGALDIFTVDSNALITVEGGVKRFSDIKYDYQAFLVREGAMKAYDCVFETSRFRDAQAQALAKAKYESPQDDSAYRIIVEITKFLADNGVDPVMDRCKENQRYLGDMAKKYNDEGLVHARTG